MLTCREVSELASQAFERRLSLRERCGIRLHLLVCRMCVRVKAQVEFVHKAARRYVEHDAPAASQLQLTLAARERIRESLQRAQ